MTTDLTALCARYKEALEMIAKGGEHPTELALLAYAALYNQPPVETAVERLAATHTYLKAVAQEVASGEASRSALKVALAQIDSEEWWEAQQATVCPQCRTTDRVTSPDYGGVCVVCWRRNQGESEP